MFIYGLIRPRIKVVKLKLSGILVFSMMQQKKGTALLSPIYIYGLRVLSHDLDLVKLIKTVRKLKTMQKLSCMTIKDPSLSMLR